MLLKELTSELGRVDDDGVDGTKSYACYVLALGDTENPLKMRQLTPKHGYETSDQRPRGWAWRKATVLLVFNVVAPSTSRWIEGPKQQGEERDERSK